MFTTGHLCHTLRGRTFISEDNFLIRNKKVQVQDQCDAESENERF